MELELSRWADRWHAEQRCTPTSKVSRDTKAVEFWIDLCRAVNAADKAEQPAPATAGDIPEWFVSLVKWIHDDGFGCGDENSRESATAIGQIAVIPKAWAKAEPEIARRVAEATKERDAEIERLKAEAKKLKDTSYCYEIQIGDRRHELRGSATALIHLQNMAAEIERLKAKLAKWESEPVGKMITELRDEERESKNADIRKLRSKIDELLNENAANVEENDRLKAELAATTKPVELGSANIREIDGMKMIYLGDAQAAVRCERAARLTQRDAEIERLKAELAEARKPIPAGEPLATIGDFQTCLQRERAARLAAEKRLALTREAWRHRWVSHDGALGPKLTPLTDADIDAAIEAHEKSKETNDGAR